MLNLSQSTFCRIASAKVLLYIDVMQRVKSNFTYIWSHFSNTGRSIILALLVVLFFIFVIFTFTFGFLAATMIIVWAILFFPAIIAIGWLRHSFNFIYYVFF
jgi:hypothetical protein